MWSEGQWGSVDGVDISVDTVSTTFADAGVPSGLERARYRALLIGAGGRVVSSGASWGLHRGCSVWPGDERRIGENSLR